MGERLTNRQAAVIGAFTGILAGPWEDLHGYVEDLMERPVWTHEIPMLANEIKEAARADFGELVAVKPKEL